MRKMLVTESSAAVLCDCFIDREFELPLLSAHISCITQPLINIIGVASSEGLVWVELPFTV